MASPSFFAPARSRNVAGPAKKETRFARASDAEQITLLRKRNYDESATDFVYHNLDELEWQPGNPQEIVIVACNENRQIIASIQAIVFPDKNAAENYLHKKLPLAETDFPALYLTRGVTDPEYRRTGIHTLIRYHFIDIAEHMGMHSLIGVVFEKASRVELMKKLGYEFTPFEGFDVLTIYPENPTNIAVLHREKFDSALKMIENLCHAILKEYSWAGAKDQQQKLEICQTPALHP